MLTKASQIASSNFQLDTVEKIVFITPEMQQNQNFLKILMHISVGSYYSLINKLVFRQKFEFYY